MSMTVKMLKMALEHLPDNMEVLIFHNLTGAEIEDVTTEIDEEIQKQVVLICAVDDSPKN